MVKCREFNCRFWNLVRNFFQWWNENEENIVYGQDKIIHKPTFAIEIWIYSVYVQY